MSPCSLVVCRQQGGDWRAEGFDPIAVFWFYFLSNPWLWQLPLQPWAAGLSCCVTAGPSSQSLTVPWGPPTISSSSSSCPTLASPVSWLSACDPAAWQPLTSHRVFLRFLGMICCNIMLDVWFGKSWFSIQLLCFGAFPCPVVQGLFG